ncbi:helix-turn-helix domain-containing protein [Lentzea sp. NPDC004782]|uniref:PucR family transcriptional regulator n=1 Tax=Lentzea sp. NPDC004782 TaxID=3154458 RepID=UPI0033B2091B
MDDVTPSGPEEFLAKVREAGEKWTGERQDDLVDVLLRAAGDDPELAELVRGSGSIIEEFLEGFARKSVTRPRNLAADLIAGHEVPRPVLYGLAPRYLIVIAGGPVARRAATLRAKIAGPGVLSTRHDGDLVLLVPDVDDERTSRTTEHLGGCLNDNGWLAVAKRSRAELADGFREASEVMRLVTAGRRPSGVYRLSDVLVEYAVMRHEKIAKNLADMIRPLRAHAMLWETLTALIDADYNRNRAAGNLFIHRSTLDYRLQRIASITGCDPTSGRGVQLLTAALIADSLR